MKITRKLLTSTVLFLLLFTVMPISSICSASSLPLSEISIGGIPYRASADYVKSIYGEPDRVTYPKGSVIYDGQMVYYLYGNSFTVEIGGNQVMHIVTTANNGLGTPAGVTVGMDRKILDSLYGSPKNIIRDQNHNISSYYYRSEQSDYIGVRFDIRNGKITAIRAGAFD